MPDRDKAMNTLRGEVMAALESATDADEGRSIVNVASLSLRTLGPSEQEGDRFWSGLFACVETRAARAFTDLDKLRAAIKVSILTAAQVAILQEQGRLPRSPLEKD